MDGVGPRQGSHRGSQQHAGSASRAQAHKSTSVKARHSGEKYWLVRSLGKVASKRKQKLWDKFKQTEFAQWPDKSKLNRLFAWLVLILFIASTVAGLLQPFLDATSYKLTPASRGILPTRSEHLGQILKFDTKEASYVYNQGYSPSANAKADLQKGGNGDPRFSASFAKDPLKGVTVTDPVNSIDFKLTPKFRLGAGKQDQNQILYPLAKADGFLVYTAQVASVKEDIVLQSAGKDKMNFEYELGLEDGLEARLEKDGSVGIYGSSLPLYGNVATGSDKDVELLQKAKQNADKTKFLFGIPAPVVKEAGKKDSGVNAHFELKGKVLTIVTENLKAANYPLTIDPSIYIQSAAQLMYGNNETNVEFDVATEQFKKGTTTGARIDEWTSTTDMNDAVWDQGMATSGGYVYRAGGKTSRAMPHIVSATTTTQATATASVLVNMPAEHPIGDLYIVIIGLTFTGTGLASGGAPSGSDAWPGTIKVLNNQMGVYWRYDTSGSLQSSYTWTVSTPQQYTATVLRIKNFDTSNPINASTTTNNAGAPVSYPSVTASQQGTLVVSGAAYLGTPAKTHGFSPGTDWADVASIHSTGSAGTSSGSNPTTDTSGMMVSNLDVPPLSTVATGSQSLAASGASSNYSSFSAAVQGNAVTTALSTSVQWARFNKTTGTVESPAPGSDAAVCSGWCTNSAYNLPNLSGSSSGAGLIGMSMAAYNGYLYVMGGSDGTNLKSTVYIAKLGANGEPSLWHPTDPNQANWVYWYKDSGLNGAAARAYHSAYAYNGKMYILGGDTNLSSYNAGALTTVEIADILPNGTLGTWSSGPALGTARYGASVQGYNGYLYLLGGNNNGTMISGSTASTSQAIYSKINSDGTLNSWQLAAVDGVTNLTARASNGGQMSGLWGGYIYVAGGCTAVNTTANGYCTTIASNVQLASINSDGSLDTWNTMANIRNQRFGSSFVGWQDSLYRFGGCSKQDTSSGDCYSAFKNVQYGNINQDGDASTVSISQPSGSGNCVDPDPYNCDLASGQGQMLSTTVILNGYLYNIGGCTSAACGATSGNTVYAAIDSNGRLKSPPSCGGTVSGAWCIDSTNTISGGIGAAGSAVFGGTIYLIGGLDGANNKTGVYRNTVNADGSLAGGWTTQTFANLGVTTGVSYTYAYARANPSSAGTYPGNLYIFGGCDASTNAGCDGNYVTGVWKCNLKTDGSFEEADANDCTTASQLQIDSEATAGSQGLGIHAGTVYANYIYLIGGLSPNVNDRPSVLYAKFDNNNNIVAVSGSVWTTSNVEMKHGRRRGTAFGYNGYIYAVGGYDSNSSQILDTIEFVKINVSDGSLISDIPKDPVNFPGVYLFGQSAVTFNQRWGLGMAVSNSYAYIIGGCKVGDSPNCTTLDSTVQTFQVYNNDSGAPGGYTAAANLFSTDRIGAGAAVLNGYLYIAGGCTTNTDCSTTTTDVQKSAIDANGTLGAWTATGVTALPAARAYGQLEVAGNTLYYLGGETGGTAQSTVYYATMGSSGAISAWTTASGGIGDTAGQAAVARTKFSSAVWNNRIYVTGGYDGSARSTHVYISPQLTGGDIAADSWTGGSGSGFNVAREGLTAIAYANNLYILGGYDGTNYLSDVQFTQINSDGSLDSWTYTTNLPYGLRQADGFASNGYMYIFGGRNSTNDCTSRTLIAPISANTTIASGNNPTGIGEWYQTNRNFDGGRYGVAAVNYQGKAYVLGGGCQGTVMQDNFDPSLDSGEWSYTTGMTVGTTCQSTSSSNVLYATDTSTTGADGNGTYAATKAVDVSSGGTVHFKLYMPLADTGGCYRGEQTGGLFSPTLQDNVEFEYKNGAGAWTQIGGDYVYNTLDPLKNYAVTIPAGAQGSSVKFRWVSWEGETTDSFAIEDVSITAIGNTAISYPQDRVAQTALLSQPQVAIYSRLVDAGNDAFPKKFLMNGIDNSIGARWQMRYRSMNDPTNTTNACGGSVMTGYGQETNFGDVTLGTPGTYTMKNGAGTDIGCGRYYFMTVSIDASQTYGYPDDISRGPTLDNLTLFFNSNPGKRLIHGKTFIEGTQQPLDTQP